MDSALHLRRRQASQVPRRRAARLVLLFIVKFAITFLVLQALYLRLTSGSTPLPHVLQARTACTVVNALSGRDTVSAEDAAIVSGDITIEIMKGCDGTDALLLLVSAFVASPLRWKHKLSGILWGIALVYGLNLIRLTSLFYVAKYRKDWFQFFHLSLWQVLFVLFAGAFFIFWSERGLRVSGHSSPKAG
ncbi:MAG: archaeosortase/exosortase family protein [Verrucomicrobia bacterium]|nr:archaeosortase/exosortase family protein [Verrucomicrobiota bacterium]